MNNYKVLPTQQVKQAAPFKTDYGNNNKGLFKGSPQDPFTKHSHQQFNNIHQSNQVNKQNNQVNKLPHVTTYTPTVPTTTAVNNYFNNDYTASRQPSQNNPHHNSYNSYDIQQNYNSEQHRIRDSYASSVNQQPSQYPSPQANKKVPNEATGNSEPFRATYDVTEVYDGDIITHSLPHSWSPKPETNDYGIQQRPTTEEPITRHVYSDVNNFSKHTTTENHLPEEYSIVTESYDNSLNYDSHIDNQNRHPTEEEFEPIEQHKLKDYYYKVSTPAQEEYTTHFKRTKPKLTEASTRPTDPSWEYTTNYNNKKDSIKNDNDVITESLPTLPPSLHFKRPNAHEAVDRDKIRKRNKNRRRRPAHANRQHENVEVTTRRFGSSTTDSYTTEAPEIHTIKSRPRISNYKPKSTTPSVTTDLSTSALPTISPTTPTIIKKKIRRPLTTPSERIETTTISYQESESNKDSPIMKIANRGQQTRVSTTTYDYKSSEIPDYSHKQDEKDTPTSDIVVSISETTSRIRPEPIKAFSFHRDTKPLEPISEEKITTTTDDNGKRRYQEQTTEEITTTPKVENSSQSSSKLHLKPRIKNKYENNRPRFSVKDYKNRMSYTTSTEKSVESHVSKIRFPQRRIPYHENKLNGENENSTEPPRKKFVPKDPRHKTLNDENADPTTEKELHSTRHPYRQRTASTTASTEPNETSTTKISSRIRGHSRRPKPTEEIETSSQATIHSKRPLRKKIKDSEIGESFDITVTETTAHYDNREDASSERAHSESAIMKIAKGDRKHQTESTDNLFEHSKRVSDLTLAASKDYNTPGLFKTVSPNSRRIPNYFTIATDDPILPIEAFFPQLNQKKET